MRKISKRLGIVTLGTALIMMMSVTVFASSLLAWDSFEDVLPPNQGDTEVSTVAYAANKNNFNIIITSLSGGYTAVRAWTESSFGSNYSNPYWEMSVGGNWTVPYSSIPSLGANVTLNLDNPVSTTTTPTVKGKWTPN